MNLKKDVGSNVRLRKLIKEILIENKTYKGQSHSKNTTYIKVSNEDFFSNKGAKRNTYSVRNNLFKRKIKEKKCEDCGRTKWKGKPIPLEVHHKDGNRFNNELPNLQILCPNCHYFTDTYKTKNTKNRRMAKMVNA